MFNISEIVRYKNCDHVVMKIKECSDEYILRNLGNGEEIKCKKEFIEKSPIETLDIFKADCTLKKDPEDQYGNFDLQVSDFLVDSSDEMNTETLKKDPEDQYGNFDLQVSDFLADTSYEINTEAIMKDHTYGKKCTDDLQDTEQRIEVQEIQIDSNEKKPKSRNKVLSENDLADLQDANTLEATKRQTKWAVTQFKGKTSEFNRFYS